KFRTPGLLQFEFIILMIVKFCYYLVPVVISLCSLCSYGSRRTRRTAKNTWCFQRKFACLCANLKHRTQCLSQQVRSSEIRKRVTGIVHSVKDGKGQGLAHLSPIPVLSN